MSGASSEDEEDSNPNLRSSGSCVIVIVYAGWVRCITEYWKTARLTHQDVNCEIQRDNEP